MMPFSDIRFALVPEQFRMQIVPLILRRLVHFHGDTMGVGPGVLANPGDLPGDLYVGLVGFDDEAAIRHFRRDNGLRELADDGELITEIRVESFKPCGHRDDGRATAVGNDVAIVDVHHVGRFDEGMVEVFVSGIEGMVDFEGSSRLRKVAGNMYVSVEYTGERAGAAASLGEYPRAGAA